MIGTIISHYKILEKVGEGGMGVVYKAHDTKLDRTVALKFLPHHLTTSGEEQARFLQEARSASALNHPNVCIIHDIKEEDGQQFIVMEYVEGTTLRHKLPLKKQDEAISYAIQIGEALHEAHGRDIVHRDIKTENIMVNTKNQVKVMDFGLAKLKGSLKLTRTSSTVGTLAYMAPEQIQGGEVDARSDLFSFGVVLFEMLTGHLPFRGEHDAAIVYSIVNEEPESITAAIPNASPELVHIVNKSLEKDPEDRYQSVSEMVVDLRRLRKESSRISRRDVLGVPPAPTTERPPVRNRKRLFFLPVGIALVLGIAAVIAYLLISTEAESGERIPIAVADFVNQTKEEELDGLSGMLITSLEQSRRLAVLTRSRMFDIMKLMGKDPVDRIDEALGREICRQADINALVLASIRKFDQLYTIDLKIVDPQKNEYLFTAKEEGTGKASIPAMIDRLSEKTRIGLKEKAAEIRAHTQAVGDLTTTNLQAYQHYFQGEQLINRLKFDEAIRELRRAVEIDSTFALAHYRLAYALSWSSNPEARSAIERAMRYLENLPPKEQMYVRGEHLLANGHATQALALYKELAGSYPEEKEAVYLVGDYSYHLRDFPAAIAHLNNVLAMDPTFQRAYQHLCWAYTETQQFDKKLEVARKYIALVPEEESFSLLADAYLNFAQFDSAVETYRRARTLFPASSMPSEGIGQTYILQNRFDQAEEIFTGMIRDAGPGGDPFPAYINLIWLNSYRGKYREALALHEEILRHAAASDDPTLAVTGHARKAAWMIVATGDSVSARRALQMALQQETTGGGGVYQSLFLAHTLLGDYEQALTIGKNRLSVIVPLYQEYVSGIRHMREGKYRDAIRAFSALPTGRNIEASDVLYLLAQCHFAVGENDRAVQLIGNIHQTYSNYFKIHFRSDERSAVYPKSLYLLGMIHEKKGESEQAIQMYQKLLTLWKDADKDIPELVDTRARLDRLRRVAAR